MSLPPGFLDELRDRLTLSSVVGRKVMWDRRKTNAAKGDFWAPCPFHQEKTPSFHVDDRKGFYYCFGCQAKGDAVTFVKETENVSFIEAVEILAREAGVPMPEVTRDPREAERRDRRDRLCEVMEQAVQLYGLAFRSAAGQAAREYAARRGLTAEVLKRFEIGLAPNSRQHQAQHFRDKGALDLAVEAGLLIQPEHGSSPYDRFRNRLMFPIRDVRGRCIAFGGRAMDPNAQAKYINSPETELFHKGRTLYNHGPAREAAGKAGALIVAEGYMDVIALVAAGFEHAVAPLGTAITEDQLQLIWRMAEEPVIALDGDAAGLRAAERLIDIALPMLAPGRSLRFCVLPEGRDPDELIRAEGPGAMRRALEASRPLIEMLWQRETSGEALDTPERRAALDRRLKAVLGRISDISVRNHYAADLKARRRLLFQPDAPAARAAGRPDEKWAGRGRRRPPPPARPMAETRNSELARAGTKSGRAEARIREAGILLIACQNPESLEPVEHALEEMTFRTRELGSLRDALLAALAAGEDVVETVRARTGFDPIEYLSRIPQARAHSLARPGRSPERVAQELHQEIARHQAKLAYEDQMTEARQEHDEAEGEQWTERVRQAGSQLHEAERIATKSEDDDLGRGVKDLREALSSLEVTWNAKVGKNR